LQLIFGGVHLYVLFRFFQFSVGRGGFDSLLWTRTQIVFLLLGNKPSLSLGSGPREDFGYGSLPSWSGNPSQSKTDAWLGNTRIFHWYRYQYRKLFFSGSTVLVSTIYRQNFLFQLRSSRALDKHVNRVAGFAAAVFILHEQTLSHGPTGPCLLASLPNCRWLLESMDAAVAAAENAFKSSRTRFVVGLPSSSALACGGSTINNSNSYGPPGD